MLCTGIAVVGISLKVSICDFEVFFRGDVVEAVAAPAEELAGVTVAAFGEKDGKQLCWNEYMYEFATLFLTRTEYLVPWRLAYYPPTMVVDVIFQWG